MATRMISPGWNRGRRATGQASHGSTAGLHVVHPRSPGRSGSVGVISGACGGQHGVLIVPELKMV